MVIADIGDHIQIPMHQLLLGNPLKLRLDSHALKDQDLRLFPVRPADDGKLLADIGISPAANPVLLPPGIDIAGGGTGGFRKHTVPRTPQMGIDQAADTGLSPDAVDMNNMPE